jgi:hypothetical protein
MPTRPSRQRVLAAIVTSATATFLLVQVLQVGHAEETASPVVAAQPAAAPPAAEPLVTARAEVPPASDWGVGVGTGTVGHVIEAAPPKSSGAKKPKSLAHKMLPVKSFGGY